MNDVAGVAMVVVLLALVRAFLGELFFIPSESMEPGLRPGDRVVVSRLAARLDPATGGVRRGDVVVFADPDRWIGVEHVTETGGVLDAALSPLHRVGAGVGVLGEPGAGFVVKRVIGTGGDRVSCCDAGANVVVDGAAIEEPYLFEGDTPSGADFDVVVPEGMLWVLGDHRSVSVDSRFHTDDIHGGFVPASLVVGRVVLRIWPLSRLGRLGHAG